MQAPLLLLWDIDGTLIHSGGAGERALVRATKVVLDVELDLREIDWAGRTDRRIAEMILEHLSRPVTGETTQALIETYLDLLPEELSARRGTILPGVAAILEHVKGSEHFAQGLLTGNMEQGARAKLSHYGIWRYFPFGAFADDSVRRNELGPHALRKASAHHGTTFVPEETYVIGDTPHDIACGKAVGARTITVATGKYSVESLREHHPTALFTDFGDTDAFLAVLDRG